jgi:hypothetical protein
MFRGIKRSGGKTETVQSYLGLLQHGNTKKLKEEIGRLEQEIVNEGVW